MVDSYQLLPAEEETAASRPGSTPHAGIGRNMSQSNRSYPAHKPWLLYASINNRMLREEHQGLKGLQEEEIKKAQETVSKGVDV